MTQALDMTLTPSAPIRPIRSPRGQLLATTLATAAMLLGGCGGSARVHQVAVNDQVPAPLIDPLPLTAVVHYSPEFSSFRSQQESLRGDQWQVDFADMHRRYFQIVADSAFDTVIVAPEPSAAGIAHDLLLVPRIDNFAFLTPQESGTRFFAASLRHVVQIYGPDGTDFGAWEINSYGRSRNSFGRNVAQMAEEACRDAMRDFAASLAVGIQEEVIGRNVVPAQVGDGS